MNAGQPTGSGEQDLPPLDQKTAEVLFARCSEAVRVAGSQAIDQLVREGYRYEHIVWILAQVALSIAVSTHHAAGGTLEALQEQIREAWRMQQIEAAKTVGRA